MISFSSESGRRSSCPAQTSQLCLPNAATTNGMISVRHILCRDAFQRARTVADGLHYCCAANRAAFEGHAPIGPCSPSKAHARARDRARVRVRRTRVEVEDMAEELDGLL